MFGLIALHVPVAIAMGITGIVCFGLLTGDFALPVRILGSEALGILSSLDLAVIPLFLLMGGFATAAGLSRDIYRLAHAFVGQLRGGLALATIAACAGFGAISGSSIATAATMTRIALPEMMRLGYGPPLAAGSVAAGGLLGIIIAPSIIMVLYAILTEQSVLAMFVAGIVPGLMAVGYYMVAVAIYVRRHPEAGPAAPPADAVSPRCWARPPGPRR